MNCSLNKQTIPFPEGKENEIEVLTEDSRGLVGGRVAPHFDLISWGTEEGESEGGRKRGREGGREGRE